MTERKTILAYVMEAGRDGGWFLALAMVICAVVLYRGAPEVYDQVAPSGPSIPPELADHQARGGIERGESMGATPSKALPRPDAFLSGLGIAYDFKGSPNWSTRGTCGVQAIVLHVTGPGSMAGMASWFNNPASQVSAHFGIGKNGEVQQYVELGDAAWHAGIVNRPNMENPLIAEWQRAGVNPNRCTIGIELLLGGPAEPLVEYPKMQATLDVLLPWLLATTGVPADRVHIVGHNELDGVNRHTDPTCCVDMKAQVAKLGTPAPAAEWGECDPSWGGVWNSLTGRWMRFGDGGAMFEPLSNVWSTSPPCGV